MNHYFNKIRQGDSILAAHRPDRLNPPSSPTLLKPLLAAMVGCGILSWAGAQAATIMVTTGGDVGTAFTCTLRQAINAANTNAVVGTCTAGAAGGDTLVLSGLASPITLLTGQITVSESLVLQGPGATLLTISGNNAGRIFDVVDSVNDDNFQTLTINGLTLRDGQVSGEHGGCIRAENPDTFLVLTNSVVTGCSATATTTPSVAGGNGGAIFASGDSDDKYNLPSVLLQNSTVSGNSATFLGGGVGGYAVRLEESVISGNTIVGIAHDAIPGGPFGPFSILGLSGGGGVMGVSVFADSSTVSGNQVSAAVQIGSDGEDVGAALGGGVLATFFYIQNSTISQNGAHAAPASLGPSVNLVYGGGLASKYGVGVIVNSTISGNLASGNPVEGTGDAIPNNVMGGGLWMPAKYGGNFGTYNSTIAGNQVTASSTAGASNMLGGAGIGYWDIGGGSFERGALLVSSIVANSVGAADIGCNQPGGNPCDTLLPVSGTANLVPSSANVTLPPGTLAANPLLAPLANNGGTVAGAPGDPATGSVRTHGLQAASPALNTGLISAMPLVYDQRGFNYPRTVGPQTDIGAYEGSIAPTPVPTLGPFALGLLSALLGFLGWRRQKP